MDLRFLAVIFLVIAIMEAIGKLLKKARLAEADGEQEQEPQRPRDPLAEVFRDLRLGQLGDDAAKPAARLVREAVERAVPMAEDRGEAVPEAASGGRGAESRLPSPVGHPRERRPPPGPAPTPVRRSRETPPPFPSPLPRRRLRRVRVPVQSPAPAAAVRQRTPSHEPIPAMAALRRRAGSDGIAAAPTPRSPQRHPWDGAVAAYISPTTLRHLVVAREVLGPPVALRAEGDPLER